MNCEPGDLAVIARSVNCKEAIGRVIRVTSLSGGRWWSYEGQPIVIGGRTFVRVSDCCLRPLRDKPGTDQTLIWAGLPRQTSPAQPLTT
jgi:hypothetical protein